MRISSLIVVGSAFVLAAILSLVAAGFAVSAIEDNTEIGVRGALDKAGHDWAEVQVDGLRVILSGTAPDEAARFNALSGAGAVVDAARIIDGMEIAATADLAPPRFSVEILRNDSGISIIGLIPAATDRDALIARLQGIAGSENVADLLEVADYALPEDWNDSLDYSVTALAHLPRSKISVGAGAVSITAISENAEQRRDLQRDLTRAAPPGLRLALDVSAPRPVITPFTLRFLIDEEGSRFDACSAESELSRVRILAAARAAGLTGTASCTIGMGVPSPNWARAVELGLAALAEIGGGSVTFSDADISLIADQGTAPAVFDNVVGELESALPRVFALHAVLPAPEEKTDSGPPEFTATLSPEGLVQLRGRLSDENLRRMASSYARAGFGSDNVHMAARVVADLPVDWPVRVLTGLEVLSMLTNGVVRVTPDALSVHGASDTEQAGSDIASLLAAKLGEGESFDLEIEYREPPAPVETGPDPESCEVELSRVQDSGKIAFEPGSATIAADSLDTMNRIAEILSDCGELRLEIQGHTDSQGREGMNQELSQARAQSVLNELRARRVLTSTYVATGYGETRPIADNGTEEGREANRRIEFRLIRPEPATETETTLDATAQGAGTDDSGDETATPEPDDAPAPGPEDDTAATESDQ
ncbi:MAG: OmpA family protein [Jhaorihella sp.]